jgi:hypothetical protein
MDTFGSMALAVLRITVHRECVALPWVDSVHSYWLWFAP